MLFHMQSRQNPTPERQSAASSSPLLTVAQASVILQISQSKAHQLAREGTLPGLVALPGHRRMVRSAVLDRWLAGETIQADIRPALRRVG